MKKILLFSMVGFVAILSAFAPVKGTNPVIKSSNQASIWTVDKPHTNIKFSVSHLVISDVDGTFKSFDGSMATTKPDFSDAKITFTADANSISTDNDQRDYCENRRESIEWNAKKLSHVPFIVW